MPIILDSNLLLLWVIGNFSPALIGKHKRLESFTVADLILLDAVLQSFGQICLTPSVLAEVSNLAAQIGEPLKTLILNQLGKFILLQPEANLTSADAASREEFATLGFTDTVLLALAKNFFILSTDFRLTNTLQSAGLSGANFRHLHPF